MLKFIARLMKFGGELPVREQQKDPLKSLEEALEKETTLQEKKVIAEKYGSEVELPQEKQEETWEHKDDLPKAA